MRTTRMLRDLTLMQPPILEEWYRCHLDAAELDISSSGVSPYTLGELRDLIGLDPVALDSLPIDDSESFGASGLRRALADRYAGGRVDRVMATHGSSEAIFLVLSALCAPGIRVAYLDPIYHSLANVPRASGATMVPLPLQLFSGPAPDWRSIESLITPDIDVVIINFPHNPTGTTLTPSDVTRLVSVVERSGAYLVWDAALEHLTVCDEIPGDLSARYEKSVVFGTLSKAFGLPGMRVGWAIAPPDVLQRTLALHDSTTLFLSPLLEEVARLAVMNAQRLVSPRLERAIANRALVSSWIESRDDVTWSDPQGGVTSLVTIEGEEDIESFCRELLTREGVLLVPGTAFGATGSVRLGYGGDSDQLREALRRLSSFLQERTA